MRLQSTALLMLIPLGTASPGVPIFSRGDGAMLPQAATHPTQIWPQATNTASAEYQTDPIAMELDAAVQSGTAVIGQDPVPGNSTVNVMYGGGPPPRWGYCSAGSEYSCQDPQYGYCCEFPEGGGGPVCCPYEAKRCARTRNGREGCFKW